MLGINFHFKNSMERTDFKHILYVKFVLLTVSLAQLRKASLHTCAISNHLQYCKRILSLCYQYDMRKLILHSKHCTQSLKSTAADNNLFCFDW